MKKFGNIDSIIKEDQKESWLSQGNQGKFRFTFYNF
jgi:hypothetical protein